MQKCTLLIQDAYTVGQNLRKMAYFIKSNVSVIVITPSIGYINRGMILVEIDVYSLPRAIKNKISKPIPHILHYALINATLNAAPKKHTISPKEPTTRLITMLLDSVPTILSELSGKRLLTKPYLNMRSVYIV